MKNKKFFYTIALIFISLAIISFLYSRTARNFMIGFNPYLLINDTDDRVKGSILGSTSPSYQVDIASKNFKLINMSWTNPEILKASPYTRVIQPTWNLGLIKIILISHLDKL